MHIAIAGNIGAGKTTLTSLLAKHYQWEAHFEDVVDNPYLDDFYHQMERWSFNLQIYFLNSRFRQILDFREKGNDIIQDHTIYEDAHIFAPNLHEMGLMTSRDFDNYKSLFALMERLVLPPDLGADVPFPKSHIAYGYATHLVILNDDGKVKTVYAAHDSSKDYEIGRASCRERV